MHNRGVIYGYARVSTDGQSVEAQVRQLTKAGCKKVFREVASGAKTDRAQLRRLLDTLAPGDVVTVTRLDRLARSTRDLLNTLAYFANAASHFERSAYSLRPSLYRELCAQTFASREKVDVVTMIP